VVVIIDVRGDRTGRVWRYQPLDRLEASGVHYQATATDDGSYACIRVCEKGTYWDDEVELQRNAIAVASRSEIVEAPTIRQLLDVCETEPVAGEFGYPDLLKLVWEWGDYSLDDLLHGDYRRQTLTEAAVEVQANIRAALEVLHGVGLVHLDVAPNNILRVGGVWKLADLDTCAERDSKTLRQPNNQRWVHPDRRHGRPVPAREEFDLYGLEQVLMTLRGPNVEP
jgi:hypothetical protein